MHTFRNTVKTELQTIHDLDTGFVECSSGQAIELNNGFQNILQILNIIQNHTNNLSKQNCHFFSLPTQTLKEKPPSFAGISLINNQIQNLNELTTAYTQTKSYTQTSPSSPTNTQDSSQLCKNTHLEYHKNVDAKDSFLQKLSTIHTLFTSFESMLFEFLQEEDLDKSHQTIL